MNPRNIKICRPDGSHTRDHFWDEQTGKTIDQPLPPAFRPEKICPAHTKTKKGKV